MRARPAARLWSHVWVHALVWLFVLFSVYPILQVVNVSLRPGDQLYTTDLRLIPRDATLDAYERLYAEVCEEERLKTED